MFIQYCAFIKIGGIFHPVRLFQTVLLFETVEYGLGTSPRPHFPERALLLKCFHLRELTFNKSLDQGNNIKAFKVFLWLGLLPTFVLNYRKILPLAYRLLLPPSTLMQTVAAAAVAKRTPYHAWYGKCRLVPDIKTWLLYKH